MSRRDLIRGAAALAAATVIAPAQPTTWIGIDLGGPDRMTVFYTTPAGMFVEKIFINDVSIKDIPGVEIVTVEF